MATEQDVLAEAGRQVLARSCPGVGQGPAGELRLRLHCRRHLSRGCSSCFGPWASGTWWWWTTAIR